MIDYWAKRFTEVHCRTGSLEMKIKAIASIIPGSLPHRQLRKPVPHLLVLILGSLPHRQLRNLNLIIEIAS